MKDFYVLSRPYPEPHDPNTNRVAYRVQTIEFPCMLLHNDRTIHTSIIRVTQSGRTYAAFPSEDLAYLAINDYYDMHGEHTPYVRVGGQWHDAGIMNTGQTTDWAEPDDVGSETMDFIY